MKEHLDEILLFIEDKKLVSLSDDDYHYKDINVLDLFGLNIQNCNQNFKNFNSIKNCWDLINCNNDLKVFTAYLFYYRPLINNPIKEAQLIEGEFFSTYFQNGADWLYSSFVSSCFEKLYNFWDRIGDFLAYYLNVNIKEKECNFPKVIDLLNENMFIKNNPYFEKLLNFKDNEFIELNKQRREIVHYYQFETTYRYEHTIHNSEREKIEQLWKWKREMPEYFRKHLNDSREGYYNAYKLLNEVR